MTTCDKNIILQVIIEYVEMYSYHAVCRLFMVQVVIGIDNTENEVHSSWRK